MSLPTFDLSPIAHRGRFRWLTKLRLTWVAPVAFFVLMFVGFFLPRLLGRGDVRVWSSLVPMVGIFAVMGLVAIPVLVRTVGRHRRRTTLSALAAANGFRYTDVTTATLPGILFQVGSYRRTIEVVTGTRGRPVEFGTHTYTIGSGKSKSHHAWSYAAVRLRTPMPNLILDLVDNNQVLGSNLDSLSRGSLRSEQRLQLAAAFDQQYHVYAPEGYGQDAFYLFTPDLMEKILALPARYDMEVVDDWLLIYTKDLLGDDPQEWGAIVHHVDGLQVVLDRWERWRDERVMADAALPAAQSHFAPTIVPLSQRPVGVAMQGQRLQRRWLSPRNVLVAVFMVCVLLLNLYLRFRGQI